MRTRTVVALPAAIALLAVAADSTPAATSPSYLCSAAKSAVLFWPHGHKQIPSVHFPNIKTPHLEVYKPGAKYPAANFLLYADAKGGIDGSASCAHVPTAKVAPITHSKTIKTKHTVTCSAATPVTYDASKTKKGVRVIGRTASFELWRAALAKSGSSTLTYDSARCKVGRSPG